MDKTFRGEAVKIADDTIVGQDIQLRGRKEHAEKVIVRFIAGMVRVATAAFTSDSYGAGAAVVSICHVGSGYRGKGFDESVAAGNAPDGMGYAVGSGEAVEGFLLGNDVYKGVDIVAVAIGEEDWTGMGTEGMREASAVIFFGFAGLLMDFNDTFLIIVYRAYGSDAALRVLAYLLLVNIEARFAFRDEMAVAL